jgi:hypothetical protein
MNKSRWITILAAVVVLAGLGMGLAAYFSVPGTSARASTLPDAAAWMPASANFVAYVDIASVLSSPLKEQWEERKNVMKEVEEFRDKTGMDPWTDFRTLSFSAGKMGDAENWGLALTGDLDPEKLIAVIEERERVERTPYGETTLYLFERSEESTDDQTKALAFPSLSTALFGSPDYVRSMLNVGTGGEASAVEGPLAEWLDVLPLNETFWCVGNSTEFHRVVNEKDGASSIPPLQSFAVSGNLGADVSMIGRARAADADSAQKLADVVRGFIAMGSLQQQDRPELQAILDSVQIDILESNVEVVMSVPFETLRRLMEHHHEVAGQ